MEEISQGLKRFAQLATKRPSDVALFAFIISLISLIGFLPVQILNGSWKDSSFHLKAFWDAASASVSGGAAWTSALDFSVLGKAGMWVFASILWKYAILMPAQISLFLSLLVSDKGFVSRGFRVYPKVFLVQLISSLAIIAVLMIGIFLTIAIFAGAAAPFFMIIVLVGVLSMLVVLATVPVAVVSGGMPVFKAFSLCLSRSLKFGWPILLSLLIPSILASIVSGWLGNLGVVSDMVLCLLSMPQYCVLAVVYERMVADA